MDDNQKERLEQELKFLKESFEAEVISKEEFEKGKGRVERKLKEIRQSEQKAGEKLKEPQKEPVEKNDAPKTPVVSGPINEGEKIKPGIIEEAQNPQPAQEKPAQEEQKGYKEENKFFKYAVAFVVLLLAAFFLYSTFNDIAKPKEKTGSIATEAKASKINVLVLNDKKECFNCDTARVLGILESWFGDLNAVEVAYSTGQGESIASKLDAKLLPFYILDGNITKMPSFSQFKQVFAKKGDVYVLNENTAGSTFYFRRGNIPNRLDFFAKSGDDASIKAEKNLKEFLDNFKEIEFEKHSQNDNLTKELNIRSFPTFLVNNRIKFSGVHTPESIKSNFCSLNKVKECEKNLSKSLA
ncbi:hypothetical protein HY487_00600 [Candidatus Woesearchaeota archaeon]|nr:hypothetical protein [Candidatus Woesearchaeota archaeon]